MVHSTGFLYTVCTVPVLYSFLLIQAELEFAVYPVSGLSTQGVPNFMARRSAQPGTGGVESFIQRIRLPGQHQGEPVKFEFSLSELAIHLNSQHKGAVSVDYVQVTWRRGPRSVTSKPTHVVEFLDQVLPRRGMFANELLEA